MITSVITQRCVVCGRARRQEVDGGNFDAVFVARFSGRSVGWIPFRKNETETVDVCSDAGCRAAAVTNGWEEAK